VSSTTTRPATSHVPPRVSTLRAYAGGGSGEIALDWTTVPGAAGYRVLRSASVQGSFAVVVDVDMHAGVKAAGTEVINLYGDGGTSVVFLPQSRATAPPVVQPRVMHRVEIARNQRQWFRVVAYNGAGSAAPSIAVCGAPPGAQSC
jgi:hypothetical protein